MTKQEMFGLMLKSNEPQLDSIIVRLELNRAFLPPPGQAIATRASSILELVEQQHLSGELEKILLEIFPQAPLNPAAAKKAKCILILASNPVETDRLMLDEEVRLIKQRLAEAEPGREYKVESEWAVRASEVSKFLLEHQPVIVHFSGHGSPTGELILQNDRGEATPVAVNVLANLFEILKGPTECVVLNACYSSKMAKTLANYVGCVVGMSKSVGDPSALRFTGGFYRGLAFGRDYHTAFRLGSNEIDLMALPDSSVPHFTTRSEDQVARLETVNHNAVVALSPPIRTWVPTTPHVAEVDNANVPKLYPVWFGTDRRLVDGNDPKQGFSGERDDKLHYGLCRVAIPKSHKFGTVGSAWWKRLLTLTDDRLVLAEILQMQQEQFWASAQQALSEWAVEERMALVFIHGFNVSFEESAIRAAQIGFDLKITGATAFYSWPSQGKLSIRDYMADEASVEASEKYITEFLLGFAQKTDAQRIQVIAHSMGNRGLLRAMQNILRLVENKTKKPFQNIIFAAPDVDADKFCELAQAHSQLAAKATLYVSDHDRAVASSGILHKAARAGFTPPVTVVPGIDTVDVSNADLTLLGHGYYGAAEGVLYDMHDLIANNAAPSLRLKLKPASNGKPYWTIG